MTTSVARGLIALVLAVAALVLVVQSVSAEGTLTGNIPGNDRPGGVAVVQWSGGSVDELAAAAEGQECRLRSAWITAAGKFVGYVAGAPEFVNADWTSEVGLVVEARPMLIVCFTPGLDSCTASGLIIDYAEFTGAATPREALDLGVRNLSEFPDGAPPEGAFVEVSVSEATPESSATAVFELVAYDGVVIGRYTVVNYGMGWLLSGNVVCYFPKVS